MSKVSVDADTGCWNWLAGKSTDGYGGFYINGERHYTHRLSYMMAKGEIPSGLELDHLCRNRGCCNPDHLEAVTRRVNLLRGAGPIPTNARKTHCSKGHIFDSSNTRFTSNGCRKCIKCAKASNLKSHQKIQGDDGLRKIRNQKQIASYHQKKSDPLFHRMLIQKLTMQAAKRRENPAYRAELNRKRRLYRQRKKNQYANI